MTSQCKWPIKEFLPNLPADGFCVEDPGNEEFEIIQRIQDGGILSTRLWESIRRPAKSTRLPMIDTSFARL